jgi:hypothetical protein
LKLKGIVLQSFWEVLRFLQITYFKLWIAAKTEAPEKRYSLKVISTKTGKIEFK